MNTLVNIDSNVKRGVISTHKLKRQNTKNTNCFPFKLDNYEKAKHQFIVVVKRRP